MYSNWEGRKRIRNPHWLPIIFFSVFNVISNQPTNTKVKVQNDFKSVTYMTNMTRINEYGCIKSNKQKNTKKLVSEQEKTEI